MAFLMEDALKNFLSELERTKVFQLPRFIEQFESAFEREGFRSNVSNNPLHILVIRLDAIGDNVLNSGFLRELRRNHPMARITLIVNPTVYPLVELCPYVNEVLSIEHSPDFFVWLPRAMELCREKLWRERFDICFIPRWCIDAYFALMLGFLSGARTRFGYSSNVNPSKARLNAGYDLLLSREGIVFNPPSIIHEAERNLFLLRACGLSVLDNRTEVWYSHADQKRAVELTKDFARGRKMISIVDGGSTRGKHYPPELFVQALKEIATRDDYCFVYLGGKDDADYGKIFRGELGDDKLLDLAGRTTLRETLAVMDRVTLHIGTDTSTLHIASALRKPTVAISREASDVDAGIMSYAARFAPWQTEFIMLRPEHALEPCRSNPPAEGCLVFDRPHCITQIEPREIVEAFERLTTS